METYERDARRQGRLLGQILTERGLLTETQVLESLQVQKDKGGLIGGILVEMGFLTENLLAQALAAQREARR